MAIKAVEMTRKIRDASHKRASAMSKEDKLRLIHEEAALFLQKMEKEERNKQPVKHRVKFLDIAA